MSEIVRIPINNVIAGGDYTARIAVGSQAVAADVILDTGSSTLAVKPGRYDPTADTRLTTTALAQEILYGTGGWTGPVVQTLVTMGTGATAQELDTFVAIADAQEPHNFGDADGILGLAYSVLNNAYDLSGYLTEQGVNPAATYPWPFHVGNSTAGLKKFQALLGRMPEEDLPPYFTVLNKQGVVANTFSFYTLRSWPSMRDDDALADPLNNGWFVIGGGETESDLYTGEFVSVDVVADEFYNTDLLAVQVGDQAPVTAERLPAKFGKTLGSNSIMDSGTNALVLAPDVYTAILDGLKAADPRFATLVGQADGKSVDAAALKLDTWPDITFIMKGTDGSRVPLKCAPSTYWQVDFPSTDQAAFQIVPWNTPQSILGLPLMNNYFTVFDRSADANGEIRFAPIASPAA